MQTIRAAIFQAAFYIWAASIAVLMIPTIILPRKTVVFGQRLYALGTFFLMRVLAGIRLEVRGRENLAPGAAVIAAKHQSAFDTLAYHALLPDVAMVMKRELLFIPLFGAYALKTKMIPVDRSAGPSALRGMVKQAKVALAEGRQVVIFPQGTRVAPGVSAPYQPGTAALYTQLGHPVVPVATNSGEHWPRRSFAKHPGTIVVEFLPPIPAGLPRRAFAAELERVIEEGSRRLSRL